MAPVKGMLEKDVLHLACGHRPFGLPQLQNLALRLLAFLPVVHLDSRTQRHWAWS